MNRVFTQRMSLSVLLSVIITCALVLSMTNIGVAWSEERETSASADTTIPTNEDGTEVVVEDEPESSEAMIQDQEEGLEVTTPEDGIEAAETSKGEVSKKEAAAEDTPTVGITNAEVFPTAASFAGGSGSQADPFKISTLAQLKSFRDDVNNGERYTGKFIVLTANVNISGEAWTPIGKSYRTTTPSGSTLMFEGTFDGQGHTISGLSNAGYTPDSSPYLFGLFGFVNNATIKNLTLSNVNINAVTGDGVGALAGYAWGDVTLSTITVTSGSILGNDGVGGILGRAYGTSIVATGCANAASVTQTVTNGKVAGIIGITSQNCVSSAMTNCTNTGTLTGSNSGGIVGYLGAVSGTATFTNCNNAGSVSGTAGSPNYTGGLIGYDQSSATKTVVMNACGNTGTVLSANSSAGGLTGFAGGVASRSYTECRNSGSVTGKSDAGGILGNVQSSSPCTLTSCTNTGNISATDIASGLIGSTSGTAITIDSCTIGSSVVLNTTNTAVTFNSGTGWLGTVRGAAIGEAGPGSSITIKNMDDTGSYGLISGLYNTGGQTFTFINCDSPNRMEWMINNGENSVVLQNSHLGGLIINARTFSVSADSASSLGELVAGAKYAYTTMAANSYPGAASLTASVKIPAATHITVGSFENFTATSGGKTYSGTIVGTDPTSQITVTTGTATYPRGEYAWNQSQAKWELSAYIVDMTSDVCYKSSATPYPLPELENVPAGTIKFDGNVVTLDELRSALELDYVDTGDGTHFITKVTNADKVSIDDKSVIFTDGALTVYPINSVESFNTLVSDSAAVALSGMIAAPDAAGASAVASAAKPALDDPSTKSIAGVIADDATLAATNGSAITSPVLFADTIPTSMNEPREDWLQAKAETILTTPSDAVRNFQFEHLDLADEADGYNTLSSDKGCYVVWAYPAGTNASTDFTMVHFAGLANTASQAEIAQATLETVVPTKTDEGLVFWLAEGNMSPFALSWLSQTYTIDIASDVCYKSKTTPYPTPHLENIPSGTIKFDGNVVTVDELQSALDLSYTDTGDGITFTATVTNADKVTLDDMPVSFTDGLLTAYPIVSNELFNFLVSDPAAVALGGTITAPDVTGAAAVAAAAQTALDDPATTHIVGVVADNADITSKNGSEVQSPVLFSDSIPTSANEPREDWLQAKAESILSTPENTTRNYEYIQLDLADQLDGYHQLLSDTGCYVVWAYPEGTDASTDFTIVHFQGLSNVATKDAIDQATLETVVPTKTDQGIVFWVAEGNMSPFALSWIDNNPTPSPTPSSGSTSTSAQSSTSTPAKTGDGLLATILGLMGLLVVAIFICGTALVRSRRRN